MNGHLIVVRISFSQVWQYFRRRKEQEEEEEEEE